MNHKFNSRILTIKNADTAFSRFLFRKFRRQRLSFSSHIWFLRQCLQHNLQPTFVRFRIWTADRSLACRMNKQITIRWIKSEIRKWYGRYNATTRFNLMVHEKLSIELEPNAFDDFLRDVNDECRSFSEHLKLKKRKKLSNLATKYGHHWPPSSEFRICESVISMNNNSHQQH